MTELENRKLMVLIPTKYAKGRDKYLNLTLQTILEHSKRSSAKVEIVVSDASEQGAEHNSRVIAKLRKRFPKTSIHYFPPGPVPELEETLKHATPQEKNAFAALVPPDGHYGANRNRLAALGALVGGRNSAWLHLDDDMPMAKVNERGELRKFRGDTLETILLLLQSSEKQGYAGFAAFVGGVQGLAHLGTETRSVKQTLERSVKPVVPGFLYKAQRIGSTGARVYSFPLMQVPYPPRGINEDVLHADEISRRIKYVNTSFAVHIGKKSSVHSYDFEEETSPGGIHFITHKGLEKAEPVDSLGKSVRIGWTALIRRLGRAIRRD